MNSLPAGPLNMAYVSTCEVNKTLTAVRGGVNVLFWFSLDLVNANGHPAVVPNPVQPLPNISCIVDIAARLRSENLETLHLVTIGGWGAQHPTTIFSPAVMWATWKEWNNAVNMAGLPGGFAGIDWDLVGIDWD